MRTRCMRAAAVLGMAALLGSGCAGGQRTETAGQASGEEAEADSAWEVQSSQTETEEGMRPKRQSVTEELEKLTGEEAGWKGLSREERLEDFDFLYQTLQENYPYMEQAERILGINWEECYQAYREQAGAAQTDWQFYVTIQRFINEGGGLGHLMLFTPDSYQWAADAYNNLSLENIPESERGRIQKIGQAYANEDSAQAYGAMAPVFDKVYRQVETNNAAIEGESAGTEEEQGEALEGVSPTLEERGETENLEYGLLENGTVGYIKVKSFDMSFYDQDRETLNSLYDRYRSLPDVIFDFTENGGGGEGYFNDLILAPNIDREMSVSSYELIKDGAYNRQFMDVDKYQPVSSLPKLPRINHEDLEDLDLFSSITYRVSPSRSKKALEGRLWMLVNENVYSSSEYAAMFTKASGFAVLVGRTTGGDGIGADPIPIVLKNSGLIVRYAPVYGVAYDGASSEEYGTEPDIKSGEGESELEACLRAIREKQNR